MHQLARFGASVPLLLALAVTGCGGDDAGSDDDASTTTPTSTDVGSDSATGMGGTSLGATSTPADTTSGADTTAGSDPTSATTAPSTSDGSTTEGGACPTGAALGEACSDVECACASEHCFVLGPLGGVCSECSADADCAATEGFGCNFGNPITGIPAVCSTTGGSGEGCESADACAPGLFCPTLIEIPGLFSIATCAECEADGDCVGAQQCAPTYDITNLAGSHACVDVGTVADDEGCDLLGDGSECQSGQCAPAAIMGIPVLAVCAPCNEDGDCLGPETCVLPEVAIVGTGLELVPGACV